MKVLTKTLACCCTGILLSAGTARAQRGDEGSTRCSFEPDPRATHGPQTARIEGRLFSADSTVALKRRVSLRPFREERGRPCSLMATAEGTFEFRDVAPGYYHLSVPDLGLLHPAPVRILVWKDSVIRLDIPVFRQAPFAACLADAACVAVLTTETGSETGVSDERKLRMLGYRLGFAFALLGGGPRELGVVVFCVPDTQEVVDALREIHPATAPRSECSLRRFAIPGVPSARARFRHVPDGWPAVLVERPVIQRISEGRARLRVGYTVGPLWAAGYECEARRVGSSWVAESCRLVMVS